MKINFTTEHKSRLQALFLILSFNLETLSGKYGANTFNPSDLLYNASITTLQGLNKSLKKDVEALVDLDEWSATAYQAKKAQKLKDWKEFVHLLIGYKKYLAQEIANRAKIRVERERKLIVLKSIKDEAEIKALGNLSIEDLNKKIAELEG